MRYALSTLALTVLLAATGNAGLFAQQHDHGSMMMAPERPPTGAVAQKVGKKGEIILARDTQAGDLMLKAGAYRVQHRIAGDRHVLHFMSESRNWSGDVQCSLEPLNGKVQNTEAVMTDTGALMKLVKVEIGGENVVHVL